MKHTTHTATVKNTGKSQGIIVTQLPSEKHSIGDAITLYVVPPVGRFEDGQETSSPIVATATRAEFESYWKSVAPTQYAEAVELLGEPPATLNFFRLAITFDQLQALPGYIDTSAMLDMAAQSARS